MRITTYRPKQKKRKRTHGFIKRSKTASGRKVLKKEEPRKEQGLRFSNATFEEQIKEKERF